MFFSFSTLMLELKTRRRKKKMSSLVDLAGANNLDEGDFTLEITLKQ